MSNLSSESVKSQNNTYQVTIDGVPFYHMPIGVAIGYSSKIQSGFFVPISESKRVRIEFGESDMHGKLEGYREKGLNHILLAEDDYYAFLKSIKKGLISYFFKEEEQLELKKLNFDQYISLVNKCMRYIGLNAETIEEAEKLNREMRDWIKNLQSLNKFVRQFQYDNQEEFLKNMLASYIGVGMVSSLNWLPQLKEKIVQVCFFCDMTLTERDILQTIASNGDRSQWSQRYLDHPVEAARILERKQSQIKREVVRAVEQHHEMPDGSGFPNGIKGPSIDPLSSIVIVAHAFIDKLVESDFAYDNREQFIEELLQQHFTSPKFNQPCRALKVLIGID